MTEYLENQPALQTAYWEDSLGSSLYHSKNSMNYPKSHCFVLLIEICHPRSPRLSTVPRKPGLELTSSVIRCLRLREPTAKKKKINKIHVSFFCVCPLTDDKLRQTLSKRLWKSRAAANFHWPAVEMSTSKINKHAHSSLRHTEFDWLI